MQLFPIGRIYDFMSQRRLFTSASLLMMIASVVALIVPGPKFGTDFLGGTEIEVAFRGAVSAEEVREAAQAAGFSRPEVIRVEDPQNPARMLIRVQEISAIDENQQLLIERALCLGEARPPECPPERVASEVKISPGGDKISVRFNQTPDLAWVKERVAGVTGLRLREGENNPLLQNPRDNKVEVQLLSQGDRLMGALRQGIGADRVPEAALRSEWIGPKAGAQLRNSAIKSVLLTLVFISVYVAFRFDLRFAPGAGIALLHDALVTVGLLTVFQREINLTTIAAVLCVVGYSINDTVVVFDRVRENVTRLRGASFTKLINVSLSETLSRTVITSGTTIFSLVCFFVWGTGTLKDFAFTLIIGIILGTYSSMYVALQITEWLDRQFFRRRASKKKSAVGRSRATAAV